MHEAREAVSDQDDLAVPHETCRTTKIFVSRVSLAWPADGNAGPLPDLPHPLAPNGPNLLILTTLYILPSLSRISLHGILPKPDCYQIPRFTQWVFCTSGVNSTRTSTERYGTALHSMATCTAW
jgi:hypothetical protein